MATAKTPKVAPKTAPKATDQPTVPAAEVPAEQTTATFVVGACPLLHDGDLYHPGFDIELTEEQALRLGDAVSPAPTDPEPPLE